MSEQPFEELENQLTSGGIDAALETLCEQLKSENKFHELFDARLMQCRQRAGAPLARDTQLDNLSETVRDKIEAGYVEACREVGNLLLETGDLRQAWMYLRPAGDEERMREVLAKTEPTDENLEQVVELSLHEGLNPQRGFAIVLDHYGVCNAITTYDSAMYSRTVPEKQVAVGQLIARLHADLIDSLRRDVQGADASSDSEETLQELVAKCRDSFTEYTYHVDISHLSSVIRMARIIEDEPALRLALDLTEYGQCLHESLRPPGDTPFEDAYRISGLFFAAQLGERVDEAIEYFGERARSTNVYEEGSAAVEVYVALLSRLGRDKEAIDITLEHLPHGTPTTGFAPPLMELSRRAGDFSKLLADCRERGDLLSYAIGRIDAAADETVTGNFD